MGLKRSGFIALCLAAGLAACASTRLLPEADGFRLPRPLLDFNDSAFVLTGAGSPREVGVEELADVLVGYDVVFFGESHRHSGVHLQQQRLLRALHDRHARWVLSMEQFERDVQGVLDDHLAGRIGESTLISKARAWDNYRTSYRPMVQFARQQGLPVVAAEAPGWAISCIGQWGPEILDRFTPAERSGVARDLQFTPGPYRDRFMRFTTGSATHAGAAASGAASAAATRAERSFAAQVARDETMAESIHQALQRNPGAKVLHLNGSFHSAGFLGTVERLQRRAPQLKIAVIDPVEVADPQAPAFPRSALAEGTALLLVLANPPDFAPDEDQTEWVRKIIAQRSANPCRYQPGTAAP